MADKRSERQDDAHEPADPDPDTVDPAPWLGQVGEGATIESGATIAHEIRELTDDDDERQKK